MDINKAIEHAKKVAEEKYIQGMLCHANPNDGELDDYINCGREHEQLAEWLEELKLYKEIGTLEEVRKAMENQTAISREIIEGKYFCPKCHNLMPYPGYCGCGQKLY